MRTAADKARRLSNFQVKVKPTRDPEHAGQLSVEYTINGFQWHVLDFLPEEALKLIAALASAIGEQGPQEDKA